MLDAKRKLFLALAFLIVSAFVMSGCAGNSQDGKELSPEEIRAVAKEAYIYAFPMLEFYRVYYIQSTLLRTGFNKLVHARTLLTPSTTIIVRPNNATLYTTACLDLSVEPYIIEVPSITDRYYCFQLIDIYTHVPDFIGSRATGTGPGKYLLAGPNWKETTVPGVTKVIRFESDLAMILGRTGVSGYADLAAANAVQDQYKLYSLSSYTGVTTPRVEPITFPVVDATFPILFNISVWIIPGTPPLNPNLPGNPPYKEMSADFITYLNFLLGRAKPVASELPLLLKFAQIGIGPDRPFDSTKLSASTLEAINYGITDAKAEVNSMFANIKLKNYWTTDFNVYIYGDREHMEGRYVTRAYGALVGLFGNPPTEAIYPSSTMDSTGQLYDGTSNQYVLTFPAGQLPPIREPGFWSLTMYNSNGFLVENPINRYSLGSQTGGYVFNPDGSLSIYIQSTRPDEDKVSNWLPCPANLFNLTLRLFIPQESAINGTWSTPAVVKVN